MWKLWHKVQHYFGSNTGNVVTWWADDELMVGFQCDSCHRLTGVYKVPDYIYKKNRR